MQNNQSPQMPCKGILKTSRSFDKSGASFRKSAKFDELNVLQTFHPTDKDYGHMKIDEPKTPYNYTDESHDELDTNLLVEKLRIAANTQSTQSIDDELSDDEEPLSEEQKVNRSEFERRRKAHYKEFEAVKLARKLIQEELDDEDDDDDDEQNETDPQTSTKPTSSTAAANSAAKAKSSKLCESSSNANMDIEQTLDAAQK